MMMTINKYYYAWGSSLLVSGLLLLTGIVQGQSAEGVSSRVRVLDNRLDTSLHGGMERPEHFYIADLVKGPSVALQVQGAVERGLGSATGMPLLINLRRYLSSDIRLWMIADVYARMGDNSYCRLGSIEKLYKLHKKQHMTDAAMADLVEIARRGSGGSCDPGAKVSLEQIQADREDRDWASYPIMHAAAAENGLFETFTNFTTDKLYACEMTLTKKADSVYALSLSKGSSNKLQWKLKLKPFVCKDGQYYIQFLHEVYLPMEKRDNTFYFQIPSYLPDIYQLDDMARERAASPTSDPPGGRLSWGDMGGWVLISALHDLRDSRMKRAPVVPGQGRECYLDLATRRIVCR